MRKVLAVLSLAFLAAYGIDLAVAQQKAAEDLKKQDTVPPATGRNLPEQAGTTEPSSKVQNTSQDQSIFVRGVLSVPGAPTDVDTAPAKFSQRTAADDQLPIAAYRLKGLNGDQRREIVQRAGTLPDRASSANAVVGAELPTGVATESLAPVPDDLAAKYPELRGTGFMRVANTVLIVDLDNSLVVGVLEG